MHNSRPAQTEYKLLGGSFQLPDRRMQMCCWRRGCRTRCWAAPPCLLPCPKTSPALPPLHLWVILISQQCIHHCPMAFWDPMHIVITTNTTLRSIYSVFSICRHKRMVLAQKEAEGLCGLLSALDGLGQVISNLLQCSHPHNGDNSSHATAELARHAQFGV